MALDCDTLDTALRPLIGAHIEHARLLIWPNADGIEAADTQLNLSVVNAAGGVLEMTLRTSPDGQTPMLEHEHIDTALPLDALAARATRWREPSFFNGDCAIEAFDLSDEFRKDVIAGVDLICFANSAQPAGIRLVFASGREMWTVTADDGNRVFSQLPDRWFDEPMTLVPVS